MAPSIFINGCALQHLPATARSGSKTLHHSISTLTHALKHLTAAESNATKTPKGSPFPSLPRWGPKMDAAPVRETGDPKRVNQTCTEVVLRGVRATDLELGEAPTHGDKKKGGANPGGKIWATDLELGKAVKLLLIGILSRDPFFVMQHLEQHFVSADPNVKELTSLREGLHDMMQCDRRQHFAAGNDLHEHPRRHSSW